MATVLLASLLPSRFAHLTPPDPINIERIRLDLKEGSKILLNVPHAFRVGTKWELLAGHDRVEAARLAGWDRVDVRDFSGTLNTDDAILAHFCRENLLRKEVSRAAIAGEWLRKHPDWSDGKVAAASGCTPEHVGGVRAELVAAGVIQLVSSRVGVDGVTRESKRAPRAPRKGALARSQDPTHKPKSSKPKTASPQERSGEEAPGVDGPKPAEPVANAEGNRQETASEVGEPTGAPPANSANSDINADGDGQEQELGVSDGGTSAGRESVGVRSIVVVPEVSALLTVFASLPDPHRSGPEHYRAAGQIIGRDGLKRAKDFHLWFGGLLLQAEIGLNQREKEEAA